MAYQEGDTSPPHTNVHNDVRTQLDQLSTEFEIPVVLPPVVGLGDVGHVDHHNLFTTAIAELSKHECEDGLEGLGGWAQITEVTGSPKRYAYNDGSTDWVAFEWTADGSLTTQAGGLVDCFLIGGGSGPDAGNGQPGHVSHGLSLLESEASVTVGAKTTSGSGSSAGVGKSSAIQNESGEIVRFTTASGFALDSRQSQGAGAINGVSGAAWEQNTPFTSTITGTSQTYGARGNTPSSTTYGDQGQQGIAIVRVPAAQAAGVDPGSWVTRIDYYAEVTDGIVTDLYQEKFYGDDSVRTENGRYASPEQPDDLIPCDPTVAEGWTYADGEFTPPPPDPSWREQAIEALQEQIKELQKDEK